MAVSRRSFLHWGGFLAMGTTVTAFGQRGSQHSHSDEPPPISNPHLVPPFGHHTGLRQMTKASFAPYVGTGFKLTDGVSQSVWVRLISAEQFPAASLHQPETNTSTLVRTSTYMLRFLGSSEKVLPQGMYMLEHGNLGTFKLLLVPSGDGQQLYAAIVTHLQ